MIPLSIEGATRRFGGGGCKALNVRDVLTDDGTPVMVSAWELTPAELEALKGGAPLYLFISGTVHPPVQLEVGEAPALEDPVQQ